MVKLLRLQQVAGGWVKTDDNQYHRVDSAKQNLLADTLDDIGPNEPVVVFCRFHADLDAVHEAAKSPGFESLELSGRRDELKRWQSGDAQVLAVQISAGGVGVDLTRARYSIYYSLSFSLGEYDQALSRVHRPGQTPRWTKEPLIFETDEDRGRAAAAVYRWQTMLRFNAANRGWAFDRLADLPRILRIPGTHNFKDPNAPKTVTVHAQADHRYNLSDFEEFLDNLGIPGPEAQEQVARSFNEPVSDNGLVVNLNAEIPAELIARWSEADMRFRNTWFRQRHDLKDQSQSGYDLALADFGIEAGLTEQQTINLIIQHRRMHGEKPRTRADYFERTLLRASQRNNGAARPPESTEPPADDNAKKECPRPRDPLAAKAALCEYISEVLGVRILRIVKITGKEPTYQLVLENAKVELNDVGKLLNQTSIRMAIAAVTNRLIRRLKPKQWDQLGQSLLDALTEEEGGPETQLEGAIRMYLEQYLTDVAFIPSVEGQPSNAIRRPTVIDGHVAINSADLQLFVNKTFLQNLSVKAVASMLSAIGAKNLRLRFAKNREQGRWLLPTDQFSPADYVVQCGEGGHREH